MQKQSDTVLKSSIEIYKTSDNTIGIKVAFQDETVWLTQSQMAELFGINKSGISRHIKNIFETQELEESATVAKIATVQTEGDRSIMRDLVHYNLDMIISVGYRVNSKKEKASNLLYFITKNHSFVDGNKRIAAACFLYFLQRNHCLLQQNGMPVIENNTLAALTLFIANSKPEEADIVKQLAISILIRNQENNQE